METGQGTDLEMWKCGNACREKMFAQKKRWNMERRKTWKQGTDGNLHVYHRGTAVYSVSVREKI